jgi:hypothetical protein
VAIPVGDLVFGTMAKPTAADYEVMAAEGLL